MTNFCRPCCVLSFLTDIISDRDRTRIQALSRSKLSYSQVLAETGTGWHIHRLGLWPCYSVAVWSGLAPLSPTLITYKRA